jgi:dolichol-phosphate mannosyltransferase
MSGNPTLAHPEISVLVPVMNEAGNIRPLIDEICDVFAGRAFEIIYIDDASTDQTADELRAALADTPQLTVLTHQHRAGQSAALRSGLAISRAPLIAVLDGDGQNIPADFPVLEAALQAIRPAQGMAGGVRVNRKDSWFRRRASGFARMIRGNLLNDSHPDSGCGLKIVDREMFIRLPYFNHMHRFMPSLIVGEGGQALAVPVGHRPRRAGSSKYGNLDRLLVGIADIAGVIWLLRRRSRAGMVTMQQPDQKTRQKAQKKTQKKASGKTRQNAARTVKKKTHA